MRGKKGRWGIRWLFSGVHTNPQVLFIQCELNYTVLLGHKALWPWSGYILLTVPSRLSFIERKRFGKANGDFALVKKFLFPKCSFPQHPEQTIAGVPILLLCVQTLWAGAKYWGDWTVSTMLVVAAIIHPLSHQKDIFASGFHRACVCLSLPRSGGLKGFSYLSFPSLHFHWMGEFSGISHKEHGVSFFSLCFCCVYHFSTFPRSGSV